MLRVIYAALLLALSGFSALVYQTLWLRMLGLTFGVTIYAASTVLAAFMAGLAIGSALAARFAHRTMHPVRWFGLAELLIGLLGLTSLGLLGLLVEAYSRLYPSVADSVTTLTAIRFVGAWTLLLLPTTLMGVTFPLVVQGTRTNTDSGRRVALLYAANTGGAVLGAWLTGYYLVSGIGIGRSFQVAAACNLLAGVLAFIVAPSPRQPLPAEGPRSTVRAPAPTRTQYAVLAVFGISGAVGLAFEIIWIRALLMFVPATAYAFATIVSIVLLGITVGSVLASWVIAWSVRRVLTLAVLELLIPLIALASMGAQVWAYAAGWKTEETLQAAAMTIFPTMLLMGAAFPMGLSVWLGQGGPTAASGARVGSFYLANLGGSILGALATGFVLIPAFGLKGALIAAAAASLAGAIVLLALAPHAARWRVGLALAGVLIFVAQSAALPDPVDGVLSRRYPNERMLWRAEGAQSTVTVHDSSGRRILYLDGLHQANDSPSMVHVHRQIGAMAMMLHPDPRRVLVIGLGGGVTAGAVSLFGRAEVDLIELSPGVVAASDWFRHVNNDVLRRPNVRLRVDDGRNHLLVTTVKYDVITADIIQPFHAGAGNLYSRQYYELVAAALADDGVMMQWIPRAESQYRLIARTFQSVFPETTVWANGGLLLGRKTPLRLSVTAYRERLREPDFSRALAWSGVAGFGGLVGQFTAGADELRRFLGEGPILSDDRPLVEFFRSLPPGESDIDLRPLRSRVERYLAP